MKYQRSTTSCCVELENQSLWQKLCFFMFVRLLCKQNMWYMWYTLSFLTIWSVQIKILIYYFLKICFTNVFFYKTCEEVFLYLREEGDTAGIEPNIPFFTNLLPRETVETNRLPPVRYTQDIIALLLARIPGQSPDSAGLNKSRYF